MTNQNEIKQQILSVMDDHKVGSLATIKNNKPHSRYMTFFHNEFTLYTPTNHETYKAREIEENPNIHVLLGYNGEGFGDSFIEFQGKAKIRDDQQLKEQFWNDSLSHYFDGPEDDSYVLLELKPTTIRLMNKGSNTPEEITFD